MKDTYKETKTFNFPGMVARVHIPDLTIEERNRRLNKIKKTAMELILETERIKNEKINKKGIMQGG